MDSIIVHVSVASWQEAEETLKRIEQYVKDLRNKNPGAVVSVEVELKEKQEVN